MELLFGKPNSFAPLVMMGIKLSFWKYRVFFLNLQQETNSWILFQRIYSKAQQLTYIYKQATPSLNSQLEKKKGNTGEYAFRKKKGTLFSEL